VTIRALDASFDKGKAYGMEIKADVPGECRERVQQGLPAVEGEASVKMRF
jgi:hypothetical protein